MDSIVHIDPPFVFTANGHRYRIQELKGEPRVGSALDETLTVRTANADPDCVGGVCPVK